MRHVKSMVRMESGYRQLQVIHGFNFRREINVDAGLLIIIFQTMGFDMLLHVVSLDESFVTIWAFVWLIPSVDLSVPVETAWISQCFAALLTLNSRLSVGTNFSSSKIKLLDVESKTIKSYFMPPSGVLSRVSFSIMLEGVLGGAPPAIPLSQA